MLNSSFFVSALLGAVSAAPAVPPVYNGLMRQFLADIGPAYPCHPYFDDTITWARFSDQGNNWEGIRNLLNSLADQGFNGLRMPMWPESDKVKGQMNMNRNDCEQLSKNVNKVIHSDAKDGFGNKLNDKFWFFKLYYSPGFDARRYQENLTTEEYTAWVRSYLQGGYSVDSISPFSANHSIMDVAQLENKSQAVDPSSIYELDVLRQLMATLSYQLEVPILVGPDRRTVQASVETFKSYNMPDEYDRRPDFRLSIQAVGTQSRYPDDSGIATNFEFLAEQFEMQVWCTMCSQEWDRLAPTEQRSKDRSLANSQYWQNYAKYRDEPMAPASQALKGNVSVFVAEAAVPRFVKGDGSIVQERNWATGDRMVDTDGDRSTFAHEDWMQKRDSSVPPGGVRKSMTQIRETEFCTLDNLVNDNLGLRPYGHCVFSLSEHEFRREQNYVGFVDVYISFDDSVLGWIETCYLKEGGECFTVDLQKGVDYRFYKDSAYSVQFLFENDSPDDKNINFIYLQSFTLALSSLALSAATLATFAALC